MGEAFPALAGALVGALVSQLLTWLRESARARRVDDVAAAANAQASRDALERAASERAEIRVDLTNIIARVDRLGENMTDVREQVAGISAVVNGLVVAPQDPRPRRKG